MTVLDTNVLIRALEQKDAEALRCLEETAERAEDALGGLLHWRSRGGLRFRDRHR